MRLGTRRWSSSESADAWFDGEKRKYVGRVCAVRIALPQYKESYPVYQAPDTRYQVPALYTLTCDGGAVWLTLLGFCFVRSHH